jgi:hypothetical protein
MPNLFPPTIQIRQSLQNTKTSSQDVHNRLLLNHTLLLLVSADTVVVLSEVATIHVFQELFVVGDDNELEIGLVLASLDDAMQGNSQSLDVVLVEIRGRFVKGDDL